MVLWRYMPSEKVGGNDRIIVVQQRRCPYCPNGNILRLAERQFRWPYRWQPRGYRCDTCGFIYIDAKVTV